MEVEIDAWILKVLAMIIMFTMIMVTGNIPLRSQSFKSNPKVLALSSAFAGGLFLSVGLLHLLPEANENFVNSYDDPEGETVDHFPWCFFITVCSFALILFIEKIATNHSHSHNEGNSVLKQSFLHERQSHLVQNVNIESPLGLDDENDLDFDDNLIREGLNKSK